MPKPVLSDSLFNADDVATAVLQEANLQVTNSDLGVVDRTSLFIKTSDIDTFTNVKAYSFNGFMFLQAILIKDNSSPAQHTDLAYINDSDFYPLYEVKFSTTSYQGDSTYNGYITTGGKIRVEGPSNEGDVHWRGVFNCWYRFT